MPTTVTQSWAAGDTDYIPKLNTQVTQINTGLGERVLKTGLDANLSAAGFAITNLADDPASTSAATVGYVNSVVSMGGSPSSVGVTQLDNGTATANQQIVIDSTGAAVVGRTRMPGNVLTTHAAYGCF